MSSAQAGIIHFAKLENSPRLQRALKVLEQYPGGLTTRQWQDKGRICNAHTVASELRENLKKKGLTVSCLPDGYRNGSNIYRYKLAKRVAQ